MPEDTTEDIAEETAETVAEAVEEAIDEATDNEGPDVDVEATVIEAPEPEPIEAKTSYVDVGDLHISGPAEMVEKITREYLKDHLDHNPHGTPHTGVVEDTAEAVTPEPVEEAIVEGAESDIVDVPPEATDWLFRERRGA